MSARVCFLALGVIHIVLDAADGQAKEAINLTHPFGVAFGEIVVDGDDVNAAAGERVQDRPAGWRPGFYLRRFSSRRSIPR